MRRDEWQVWAPTLGVTGHVVAYGQWGRPVLHFPSEGGSAYDIENNGIIHVLAPAIEAGRIKVYTVDANDDASWSNRVPRSGAGRARAHNAWFAWITDQVVPAIHGDCGGWQPIVTAGASMGAYHAVNARCAEPTCSRTPWACRATTTPPRWHPLGRARAMALYFNNPLAYVPHLHGDHLDWLRSPGVHPAVLWDPARWRSTRPRRCPPRGAGPGPVGQGDPVRPGRLGHGHPA